MLFRVVVCLVLTLHGKFSEHPADQSTFSRLLPTRKSDVSIVAPQMAQLNNSEILRRDETRQAKRAVATATRAA